MGAGWAVGLGESVKEWKYLFQYINVGLIIKKVIKNDIWCKTTRNKGTGRLAVSCIPL